ncbi:type VII secretion protein EccCa [Micromonospora craniellae]|uniref:Type VII secretion protein EccCa n=2 Tax=Micromonospora craniellae TaxID=2294034 RepID=A0A372FYM4_9ACTN|nr:type VII secretion protein EccCa [Micromonospora craniellae]RFS45636.1 type VII secretion protein EccCa [Micromonospora craniellae]
MPSGELVLQEPPSVGEPTGDGLMNMIIVLPMAVAGLAMMAMFLMPVVTNGAAGVPGSIMPMAFGVMIMSGILMQFASRLGNRRGKLRGERRDYLRYLGQIRRQVRTAADGQRTALLWRHPDPDGLWSVALTGRLWERRRSHPDFAEIRISLCEQRLALTISPLQTKPIEDLEPLSARALRRFIAAYGTVPDLPTAIFLRGFAHVHLDGDPESARGLTRAMIAQMVTFHAPDDLRIIVCAAPDRSAEWDWVKWLPHAQHTSEQDGAGAVRMFVEDIPALEQVLTRDLDHRPRFEAGASPEREEPYVVVVIDGLAVPAESRLAGAGYRNAVILAATAQTALPRSRTTLRLDVRPGTVDMVNINRTGAEIRTFLGCPDALSTIRAGALARTISPYRLGATHEIVEPMVTDFDLGALLGIGDVDSLDPAVTWRRTAAAADRFRVPIGIAENGKVVELDIKEAAQGGMGPHGLLIGATGSGKSELLRTLVLALAMTHSSEYLNFVLTDFKGGATFLGLDELPHTSAVITNLADEEGLVVRMQDAIQGELIRRQELLRRAGNYSSLLEYEAARRAGTPLDPMPTLFIVVDEFSELIVSHPDFVELFVMIGRVGRSLGVHLLLASQRIDEGRIHKLESHLSYRISLRTFSAMESRSVIGVPDAYQLPKTPGSGFIRTDVATLVRFRAAYVSGRYQRRTQEERQEEVRRQVVAFGASPVVEAQPPPVPVVTDEPDGAPEQSLLQVAVGRLRGQGPPAHQVWLPPLASPATLDQVLPPLLPDPKLGLTSATWPGRGGLRIPVGVIDKPFEQLRDLLMLDLSGAGGHVGIAGGPQSGKSTMLRTVIAALALTHTPEEVQFYCLDFGGGGLAALASLPHVGGIANRMQPELISRTVAEVQVLVTRREQKFAELGIEGMAAYRAARAAGQVVDPYGDVFLVVDGWASLRADFEEQDVAIREISSRGLNYGVHVILTTSRWSEIYSALRDQLGSKLELRLGESIDSLIDIRAAGTVPRQPGRGLTMDKLHYLATIPRIDGRSSTADLPDAARSMAEAIADSWTGPAAPPVRMLPALLPAADLPGSDRSGRGGALRVPLGVAERDFAPVWHDFGSHPHLTIMGDNGSGKSAALRLVVSALTATYPPEQAQVLVLDSRRALLAVVPREYQAAVAYSGQLAAQAVTEFADELRARLPGPEVTPQRLARRDWWTGPEYFVLVDDYDLLMRGHGAGPLDSILDLLPVSGDIGLHVVISRPAAGSARLSMDPVIRRLQESNTPDLVLSCPPTEMPLLNGMRPRVFPPGRGMLVTRRSATQLQVGWTEPGLDDHTGSGS